MAAIDDFLARVDATGAQPQPDAVATTATPPFSDPAQEAAFQAWNKPRAVKWGIDPNPDNPLHQYDYRKAYLHGAEPDPVTGHWPSEFKLAGHPNRYVGGEDTITGQRTETADFLSRVDAAPAPTTNSASASSPLVGALPQPFPQGSPEPLRGPMEPPLMDPQAVPWQAARHAQIQARTRARALAQSDAAMRTSVGPGTPEQPLGVLESIRQKFLNDPTLAERMASLPGTVEGMLPYRPGMVFSGPAPGEAAAPNPIQQARETALARATPRIQAGTPGLAGSVAGPLAHLGADLPFYAATGEMLPAGMAAVPKMAATMAIPEAGANVAQGTPLPEAALRTGQAAVQGGALGMGGALGGESLLGRWLGGTAGMAAGQGLAEKRLPSPGDVAQAALMAGAFEVPHALVGAPGAPTAEQSDFLGKVDAAPPPETTPEPFTRQQPRQEIPPEHLAQIAHDANPEGIRDVAMRMAGEGIPRERIASSEAFKVETQLMRGDDAAARAAILDRVLPQEAVPGGRGEPTAQPVPEPSGRASEVPLNVRAPAHTLETALGEIGQEGAGPSEIPVPSSDLDAMMAEMRGESTPATRQRAAEMSAKWRGIVLPSEETSASQVRKPGASQAPQVGRKVYRGYGRQDRASVYADREGGAAVAGPGNYYSFNRKSAGEFGPNIEERTLDLKNPLVITDGAQWRALTREAGWKYPNPLSGTDQARQAKRLREVVLANGHDGIIVDWDAASGRDIGPRGENWKLLRRVFDEPQVVDYRSRAAEMSARLPAERQIPGNVGPQGEMGGKTLVNEPGGSTKAEPSIYDTQPIPPEVQAKARGESGGVPINVATLGLAGAIEHDVIPKAKSAARFAIDALHAARKTLFIRTLATPQAVDEIMARKGDLDRIKFETDHVLRGAEKYFDQQPTKDAFHRFVDEYKLGVGTGTTPLTVKQPFFKRLLGAKAYTAQQGTLQGLEDYMRADDAHLWTELQRVGADPAWKDDHYRSLWKVVPGSKQARGVGEFFSGQRAPLRGSGGMLKPSSLDTLTEGISKGGVPAYDNPVTMWKAAQADGWKYVKSMDMLNGLRDGVDKVWVESGHTPPPGFVRLDDYLARAAKPGSAKPGQWYLQEGAGGMLNNFISRDWVRESMAGKSAMELKNQMTGVELAFGGMFHLTFEAGESTSSQMAAGLRRAVNLGVLRASPRQFARGVGEFATAPFSAKTTYSLGRNTLAAAADLKSFVATPEGAAFLKRYPDAATYIDDGFKAGLRASMPEEYRTRWQKSMEEHARQGNVIGAAVRAPFALNEATSALLFDHYIPRLKWGAFMREYALRLEEKAPQLRSGKLTRGQVARQVVDSIDERFGEMNYDNLFLNRGLKAAGQIMWRAPGWRLGTARAVLGAVPEQLREVGQAVSQRRLPQLEQRMAWLGTTAALTATLGAATMYAFTGKWPQKLVDYTHPQVDKDDPSVRVQLPTYVSKDVMAALHKPGEYVKGGLSAEVGRFADILRNRDFYGTQVYDPKSWKAGVQMLLHMVPANIPFSSFKQMRQSDESRTKALLGFFGLPKAPRYVTQTPLEASVDEAMAERPRAATPLSDAEFRQQRAKLIRDVRSGAAKPADLAALIRGHGGGKKAVAAAQRSAKTEPLVSRFGQLTLAEATAKWPLASAEERAKIEPAMRKKLAAYIMDHGMDAQAQAARSALSQSSAP